MLPLSAGLHLVVILLLLFGPRPKPPPEEMLSSPVAMIFQPPKDSRMATPHPTKHAVLPAPAPAPPPAAPPAPRPVAPPPAPPPQPVPMPVAPPPPPPAQSAVSTPASELPLPPPALPAPPPEQSMVASAVPLRPVPPRTRPSSHPQSDFPAPMALSLGTPKRTASARAPASADAGRAARGPASFGNSVQVVSGHVDPSWFDMLHQWLQQHGYYPEQAVLNNEDGTVVVQFVVNRYGRVVSVEKEMSSGSQWLDMATMGLLRDAHLPPLPPDSADQTVTINLYYHYILVR